MSSQDYTYVIVLCESDSNYINAEPMNYQMTVLLCKTYLVLWNQLVATKVVW